MSASVEQAIVARLKTSSAVNDAVAGRVFTVADSQDTPTPAIVVTKLGAEGGSTLDGGRALRRWTVQVDGYADTELEAQALGEAIRESLAPVEGRWRDFDAGVHGSFFEDSTAGITDDGVRVQSETFGVWFQPTA